MKTIVSAVLRVLFMSKLSTKTYEIWSKTAKCVTPEKERNWQEMKWRI
jgi:hypothetical protein